MNTYQGLKTLCTLWLLVAFVIALIAGIGGGIQIVRGDFTGGLYIIGAAILLLSAQTFSEIVSLLIDIAQSLQRRTEPKPPIPKQRP